MTPRDYQDAVRGAVHRFRLMEDLVGELRVDVHRAAGSKFHDVPAGDPPPDAPTFERIVGRARWPFIPEPEKAPEPSVEDEIKAEQDADRVQRAELLLAEAIMTRDQPQKIAPKEGPPSPPR